MEIRSVVIRSVGRSAQMERKEREKRWNVVQQRELEHTQEKQKRKPEERSSIQHNNSSTSNKEREL